MKRFLAIICAMILAVCTLQAKKIELVGTWTYEGTAVAIQGKDIFKNMGSGAAAKKAELRADEMLERFGVHKGEATVTFFDDGSMSVKAGRFKVAGRWTMEKKNVSISFGSFIVRIKADGKVRRKGKYVQLLFPADRLMPYASRIMRFAGIRNGNAQLQELAEIVERTDGLKIGVKLSPEI